MIQAIFLALGFSRALIRFPYFFFGFPWFSLVFRGFPWFSLGLGIESQKSIKSIFRKIEKNRFFPTDFFDSENVAKNVAFRTYFSPFKDFRDFFPTQCP